MRITFSNLGAIKKTTLDLRPLTVIIGPNNSNKTYIAYSIYGLWQTVLNSPASALINSIEINETNTLFSAKIDNQSIDAFIGYFKDKAGWFSEYLDSFFQDSSKTLFRETKFNISITRKEIKDAIVKFVSAENQSLDRKFNYRYENNTIYGDVIENFRESKKTDSLEVHFIFTIVWGITHSIFSKPFPFPAERNALILTYKILETRRYRMLKLAQRTVRIIGNRDMFNYMFDKEPTKVEDDSSSNHLNFPQPIEDFLDFLADIEFETNSSEDREEKISFYEIAETIEKSIQSKNKTYFESTNLGGRELKVNIKKGLDIDLYNASSSIKQLAPLLLYLRYRAKEGDLLIIDEPEMNLHPESQAKLLEVLGMLVNAGVNVLLTTHSPYFMSHLNNLIAGDMNDEAIREKQAKSLYLEDSRAFLKPEDVSAYEMRQNKKGEQTLHDLHDKDYGIRWDTLSDVSADIQQKFFEIYERKEKSSNGEEEK